MLMVALAGRRPCRGSKRWSDDHGLRAFLGEVVHGRQRERGVCAASGDEDRRRQRDVVAASRGGPADRRQDGEIAREVAGAVTTSCRN